MPTKFPNLEIISKEKDESPDYTERRRMPRLSLSNEQFRLTPAGKVFSVIDLSFAGMALKILTEENLVYFTVGAKIQGMLNLHGEKYAVEAQVKHIADELVGCQLENQSSEVQAALKKFLDPMSLGSELRPIPSSEGGPLWYHGPGGTDLLLWRSVDGEYRRLTLFVLGNYINWDREVGLATGTAQHGEDRTEAWGVVRFETMLLSEDPKRDLAKLQIAKAVFSGSNLPQDLKNWCIRQIEVH